MTIHSILIICRFCIYKFTDSLKVICNPKSILMFHVPWSCTCRYRAAKMSHPTQTFPAEALLPCFSCNTVNKCLFHTLFSATHFTFFCAFGQQCLLDKYSAVQYYVLCKKVVTCHVKTHVRQLHWGTSYSAVSVGPEFNINLPKTYIKQTHIK